MPPSQKSTSTVQSLYDSGVPQTHLRSIEGIDGIPSCPLPVASPLLFLLNEQGQIVSLGWPEAGRYGLDLQEWVGQSLAKLVVVPNLHHTLDFQDSRSFTTDVPWQLQFPRGQVSGFVQMSPVQTSYGEHQWFGTMQVVEIGLSAADVASAEQTRSLRLIQLTWNIRRTLDLETIWRQTLEELIQLFPSIWGVFCSYDSHDSEIHVKSTFSEGRSPLEGAVSLSDYPVLRTALRSSQPIVTDALGMDDTDGKYLITVSRHQGQPNGVIILKLFPNDHLEVLEPTLFQGAMDQVGTAVAHAYLLRDAQGLTDELQTANQRLRQKHRELEDARQQAEDASRLKSEFLANTSHELRTPLNGMIGFLRLILDGMADDPEEQEEFLQEAHKSAIHLLNLINDVLDIAKIEAGKMQIDMAPVKLRELFADLENFTRPQAEQKGLAFNISLPSTRDEITVNGNYQRLLQVMLNLVGNAIKFTHEGNITIDAEIKFQKVHFQNQDWPGIVKVKVADTGIGVSLEKQGRLFQTFSQVDGERTRQYGGTGLGLAISQRLIEAMGGVVQFISMGEGLGSTVTFTALLYHEPVLVE